MGLTCQSCGKALLNDKFNIKLGNHEAFVIALAGNPNVGKSTVFNALTGLKQHTGNWPGKTVTNARGHYTHKDKEFMLVDLPGTYSLLANSVEEQVARDFICFGKPNATVVVVDATCLERNLNLVLQVMELTDHVVLCVNLMDEARRKGISVDLDTLQKSLGIPVVGTTARSGEGLTNLMDEVHDISLGLKITSPKNINYSKDIEEEIKGLVPKLENIFGNTLNPRWVALRLLEGDQTLLDSIHQFLYTEIYSNKDTEVACFYE
ncbi:FeoB small GTPase domain-containing protein [Marinisporobacter balticus]|uniref:Ferrous iron transport protein B n=1 Tax=Marinisporobacter balticus TaxID=2018667 RepID=A0A4R2KYT2_9FIRM|nr:FeoB small GTPase domain-containing protein [Marinisporobacter balticus]TCO78067.1 ferrous iron transport protein B [Marinisporobacter balticus]